MPLPRPARAVLTVATAALVAASLASAMGCNEILFPCGDRSKELTAYANEAKFLDGDWTLVTVDGKPKPANGFPIPGTSDRVLLGELRFATFNVREGDCAKPKQSTGEVVAVYQIGDAAGKPKGKLQKQAGSFSYDHQAGRVTISALGHSATANVTTQGVDIGSYRDMAGSVPVPVKVAGFDFGTITFNVVFTTAPIAAP